MGTIQKIAQLGDPVLRRKARAVDNISSPVLRALVDDLFETVRAANGAGIAAPQVSRSDRLIIVCSRPSPRYPYAPEMEPTVMINPRIDRWNDKLEKDWEGCLSIPGIRARVPRNTSIGVSYESLDGISVQREFSGFVARVFQHEVDHLDGMVYLDRVESNRDIFTEQEFLKDIAARPAELPDE